MFRGARFRRGPRYAGPEPQENKSRRGSCRQIQRRKETPTQLKNRKKKKKKELARKAAAEAAAAKASSQADGVGDDDDAME